MRRITLPLLLLLLVGCGPTRTAGTKGVAAKDLAVLTIKQHNAIPGFHINKVTFDDGDTFDIDGDRDFYLTPGQHKVAVGYGPCVHGPHAWFSPMGDWAMYTPKGAATGELRAGRAYALRGWVEGVGSMESFAHAITSADWKPPGDDD